MRTCPEPRGVQSSSGDLVATVQLIQWRGREPVVGLVLAYPQFGDLPAEEYPVRLDGELAYALGWTLRSVGREAVRPLGSHLMAPGSR